MLPIAKILKSNGTEGDLLIGFTSVDASEIKAEEPVFIYFEGLPVPFFIESLKPRGSSRAIVHITDVDTLKDAEEIVGRQLCIDVPDEEDDTENFEGWMVFDGEKPVGMVSGFEDIPGNPCLVVGDVLIPLHEDFIVSADPDSFTLTMKLPEGLI